MENNRPVWMEDERLREALRVYLVMGSAQCGAKPEEVLAAALRGGVTMFQYREKGAGALQGEACLALGRELRRLCRDSGVPFIVNDDVELALALEADGVHVGQEDAPVAEVRRRIGAGLLLGVSAHDEQEAAAALEQGADYLGVGPIYPTATKSDAREACGPSMLARIRGAGIALPMVGIGGIDAANAGEVVRAGADGAAVVSAISRAADPQTAAAALRRAIAQAAGA